MKGTIELRVNGENIECHVSMSRLDPFDKLVIVDSVVRALRVDPLERKRIGIAVAAGGVEAVCGGKVAETLIDLTALKKQKGKQDNEADSH